MLPASTELETPSTASPAAALLPPLGADSPSREASPTPEVAVEAVIQHHLRRSSYASLRSIDCQVSAGTVRLSGQLPSFFLKQTAQEIVRRIAGVAQVHNHLEVVEH